MRTRIGHAHPQGVRRGRRRGLGAPRRRPRSSSAPLTTLRSAAPVRQAKRYPQGIHRVAHRRLRQPSAQKIIGVLVVIAGRARPEPVHVVEKPAGAAAGVAGQGQDLVGDRPDRHRRVQRSVSAICSGVRGAIRTPPGGRRWKQPWQRNRQAPWRLVTAAIPAGEAHTSWLHPEHD